MAEVQLKLTKPDVWDDLTVIIHGAHADSDHNIVQSQATLMFRLNGEQGKDIFYQLAMAEHDNGDDVQTIKVNNIVYNLSRPFWTALYNVLFRWVQAMSMAFTENSKWNERL